MVDSYQNNYITCKMTNLWDINNYFCTLVAAPVTFAPQQCPEYSFRKTNIHIFYYIFSYLSTRYKMR